LTEGRTGEDVARLVGMPPQELRALLDAWHGFHRAVRDLTRDAGGIFLDVDPEVFAGMSYRDFASMPADWHYSAEANRRLSREIAEKLGPHLQRR
jgi:hypothetical protein